MPKRSNTFQRLVKLLHERIDTKWEVCESEMLSHSLTGNQREVDIVLKYKLGQHQMIVSIECIDHKRKADSTWVETMAKKHDYLPTSKLVLWSASGFYKPALITAKKLHIDTISQNRNGIDWSIFSQLLQDSSLKLVTSKFSYFIDAKSNNGNKIRLEGPNNYLLRGVENGVLFAITKLMQLVVENNEVGATLLYHATKEQSDFWIKFTPPFECQVLDDSGEWIEPFRIGFGIKANVEETKLETRSVVYENIVSTLSVGKLKNGLFELFAEEKINQNSLVKTQFTKK